MSDRCDRAIVVARTGEDYAPNQAAIDLLNEIEAGRVQDVCIVTRAPDGRLGVLWSHTDPARVLEAASMLRMEAEMELLAEQNQLEAEPEGEVQ